jgi:hypothetical protein
MREDGAASGALHADGAAPGDTVPTLLCAQCASDYAERTETVGCARCGESLRVGVHIEGHDVADLCAQCAVGVAAAAAAQAAAAPLLARLDEIEAGAPRPNPAGKTMGRDRRCPAYDCCGAKLGDGYDQYSVHARGGGTTTRPVAPLVLRLLRADTVTFKVLIADAAGSPPSIRDYFFFEGVVRGMALETFGQAVELYSETLGLRFVVPLIEFFGAGDGVDEDYLPAATRDGIDSSALAVDVEEGTQALPGSEGEPLLLQGDDLKQARIRLALARRDEPTASFGGRADDDGKGAAPPPAAPRPAAAAAEWVRQPGVESDVTARGSCFVLTDEARDSTAAVGVDERRAAEQQRVDALALSAATTPLAAQRESPEQVSARHAVAVRAHGLAAVATASPEVDRTVPEALVVPGLETIPIVLIQATDDDPEVVAWFTGGRAPTHLRSVYGCPMEWVHAVRGWDKLRRGWFYVSVNGRGARYQIFEHYGLGLAATTRLSGAGGPPSVHSGWDNAVQWAREQEVSRRRARRAELTERSAQRSARRAELADMAQQTPARGMQPTSLLNSFAGGGGGSSHRPGRRRRRRRSALRWRRSRRRPRRDCRPRR